MEAARGKARPETSGPHRKLQRSNSLMLISMWLRHLVAFGTRVDGVQGGLLPFAELATTWKWTAWHSITWQLPVRKVPYGWSC